MSTFPSHPANQSVILPQAGPQSASRYPAEGASARRGDNGPARRSAPNVIVPPQSSSCRRQDLNPLPDVLPDHPVILPDHPVILPDHPVILPQAGSHSASPRRAAQKMSRTMVAVLTAAVVVLSGTMAYSAWRASIPVADKVITAGDLSVTLGSLTWNSPEQKATGDGNNLANFVIAPGQTLILRQQIAPHVVGDNLRVSIGVSFPSLPGGVVGTWHLEADDVQVAPGSGDVPISQTLMLPVMGDDTTKWVVVVTLTMPAGDAAWIDPSAQPTPQPQALTIGVMTVNAKQVRCGDGFTVAC